LAWGVAAAVLIPSAFAGFNKLRPAGEVVSLDKRALTGKSPLRHQAPPRSKAADNAGLRLRGLVVNADIPYIGEFSPTENLTVTNIYEDEYLIADGSAVYADGKFYVQYPYSPSIGETVTYQVIYDAETWDFIDERDNLPVSSSAICMTYDPIDCTVYGYFHNDDENGQSNWFGFGRMNLATSEVYMYNSVDAGDGFMCIAASPDGYIYGVDLSGQYCRIDKKTGVVTVLGHTDVKPLYIQSATVDWKTGTFYWAGMTDTGKSSLYKINPETYMAEKVADFPDNQEIVGLYVAEETSSAQTPEAVSEIELTFDRDNLNGTVSFLAPETTVGGNALGSALKAHVAVDGKHYEADATPR